MKKEKISQSVIENGTSLKNLYTYSWSLQSGKHRRIFEKIMAKNHPNLLQL